MKLVVGNRVTYKNKNSKLNKIYTKIIINNCDIEEFENTENYEILKVEACNWEEIEFEEVNNEVNEIEEILEREE